MRGTILLEVGAALAVAVILIVVFTLLLLADLLCILRHRRLKSTPSIESRPSPSLHRRPLSFPFYSHGVLCAPTNLLLANPNLEAEVLPPSQQSPPFYPHRISSSSIASTDHFISISNPIFDRAFVTDGGDSISTPFETPETSPSHLGMEDEGDFSPPLRLMKKLPRSLATSVRSATETNRGSFSFSASPSSSPSW